MILNNRKGKISRFETILILVIIACLAFFVFIGLKWEKDSLDTGNDSLRENTAKSVAIVNSNNGIQCMIKDCPSYSGGTCTHQYGTDGYFGYYDDVSNTIVGDLPSGYNDGTEMNIDGKKYYGDRGTMVIKVTIEPGEEPVLSWVKGKE